MRLVRLAAVVAGVVLVGLAAAAFLVWSSAKTSTVGELEFANRLAIPPLAEPRVDGEGRKVFDLELEQGVSELLPGKKTETWAPQWTIDQPATMLWYHPHPHPETEDQVYRGLVGMFILNDPKAAELPL